MKLNTETNKGEKKHLSLKYLIELHKQELLKLKKNSKRSVRKFLKEFINSVSQKRDLDHIHKTLTLLENIKYRSKKKSRPFNSLEINKRRTEIPRISQKKVQNLNRIPDLNLISIEEKEDTATPFIKIQDHTQEFKELLLDSETLRLIAKHNLNIKQIIKNPFISKLVMKKDELRSTLNEAYQKSSFLKESKSSTQKFKRLNSPETESYLNKIKNLKKKRSAVQSDFYKDKISWVKNTKKVKEVDGNSFIFF